MSSEGYNYAIPGDEEGAANHEVEGQSEKVQQLFGHLTLEIERKKPANVIYFIVEFICKHYPYYLGGIASIFSGDPDLELERFLVLDFLKSQKIPPEVGQHFVNAGFDTLETLCTVTPNGVEDVEKFAQTTILPGHKVRLRQVFSDICVRVRVYRSERESYGRYNSTIPPNYPLDSSLSQPLNSTVTQGVNQTITYGTSGYTQQPSYGNSGQYAGQHFVQTAPVSKTEITPTQSLKLAGTGTATQYRLPNPPGTFYPPRYIPLSYSSQGRV